MDLTKEALIMLDGAFKDEYLTSKLKQMVYDALAEAHGDRVAAEAIISEKLKITIMANIPDKPSEAMLDKIANYLAVGLMTQTLAREEPTLETMTGEQIQEAMLDILKYAETRLPKGASIFLLVGDPVLETKDDIDYRVWAMAKELTPENTKGMVRYWLEHTGKDSRKNLSQQFRGH